LACAYYHPPCIHDYLFQWKERSGNKRRIFLWVLFLHSHYNILIFFNSAPSDAPIEYNTVQFHANTGDDTTEFQGPSSPETDAAWEKLLNGNKYAICMILFKLIDFALVGPGMIWIDDETAGKLPHNTTRRINGEGYVGVVEMFHQLHCLVRYEFDLIIERVPVANPTMQDRIRVQFYNHTRNDELENPKILKAHTGKDADSP
jgi:hypothetical protein